MAIIGIKKLFTFSFWEQVLRVIINTSKRFTLATISLTLLALLVFSEVHDFNPFDNQFSEKIILLLGGGFIWFSTATLLAENRQWEAIKKYLILLGVYLLYIFYVQFHPKFTIGTVFLLASVLLSLSFFPRLLRNQDNASDWFYNYRIIAAIAMAALAGVILSGGLSLTLLSMGYLFEFKVNGKFYADIWMLGLMIFAPFYVLSQLPNQFDFEQEQCGFPKGVYFILNFVMVPLALIYMIILYAYFGKILLQWELPRGHLGWMISVFGVIGILTHLAIYPLSDKNKPMLGWFYRNFYRVMIVPLILFAVAIGTRINQYGITEKRYIVVVCLIWFSFLILVNIFKNRRFQLKTVTLSLAILCFSSAFGPWGIMQLPISSQFSQFKKVLDENGLLKDGKIQPSEKKLDLKVRQSLSSIAWSLAKKNKIKKFRVLFDDPGAFDKKLKCSKSETVCRSRDIQGLLELMKIQYVESWRSYNYRYTTITLTTPNSYKFLAMVPVSGYDYYLPLRWIAADRELELLKPQKTDSEENLFLSLDKSYQLHLKTGDSVILSFDILDWAEQFPKGENSKIPFDQSERVKLSATNNGYSATLFITQASLNTSSGATVITNISGHLLIKKLEAP